MLAAPKSPASPEGHPIQNASGWARGRTNPSDKLHHTPVPVRDPTVTDSRNNEHTARSVWNSGIPRPVRGGDSCRRVTRVTPLQVTPATLVINGEQTWSGPTSDHPLLRRKVSGRRRWRRGTPMHPSVFHLVPVRGLVDLVMCRPRWATLQEVGHVHGQVGEDHRSREPTRTRSRKFRALVQTTRPFKRQGVQMTRSIGALRCSRDAVHREPRCH